MIEDLVLLLGIFGFIGLCVAGLVFLAELCERLWP